MSVVPENSSCSNEPQPKKESCENHAQCMKMIQAILDGEATEEQKAHFRDNMDVCMPCINEFHLIKCIKESLCEKSH